ncbi:MAG: tetratricopeptide repeat protein [Candidatus Solibacter sp.]
MKWLAIGLLFTLSAAAETPVEKAINLNGRGNRLAEASNYVDALPLYREAIDVWRSMGEPYEGHMAATLLNYGIALAGDGQRGAAVKVLENALALHRKSLGPEHHRTITNMNLLAGNYLMLDDAAKAETLLSAALPIERSLYPEDLQTARTLEGLSSLSIRNNRPADALALAEEALTMAIKTTGEDSVDTALAYTSVAEAHRYMGAIDRALPLYRKALMLYEKALGPRHPRVATLLSQEGLILMHEGKLSMAEKAMLQCLDILRASCPDCVAEIALAETNLGLLRLKQKRWVEANEALTTAVEMREKFAIQPGPELADALQNLAIAREKLRMFDDAARLNSRAQTIRGYR